MSDDQITLLARALGDYAKLEGDDLRRANEKLAAEVDPLDAGFAVKRLDKLMNDTFL